MNADTNKTPNYWLVGAMWGGQHDQSDKLIRRGYWELGWEDEDQPAQAKLRDRMEVGDRIAIKSMLGQGSKEVLIKALGVITDFGDENRNDKHVYVKWLVTGLERRVPSKGAYKSISGPFSLDDPWVQEAFCI